MCDEAIVDPFKRLDALFRNAAMSLQSWGQRKMGNIKVRLAVENWVILRREQAQESRTLTVEELWLRRT